MKNRKHTINRCLYAIKYIFIITFLYLTIPVQSQTTTSVKKITAGKEKKTSAKTKPAFNTGRWGKIAETKTSIQALDTFLQIEKSIHNYQPDEDAALLHCYIASTYYELNQYTKAIEHCKKAISIDPENHNAYSTYGNILTKLAKGAVKDNAAALQQEALQLYNDGLAHYNSPRILRNKGILYMRMAELDKTSDKKKHYQEAIQCFLKSTKLRPHNNDLTYENWAIALTNLGQESSPEEAENMYREAIQKIKIVTKKNKINTNLTYNWAGLLTLTANSKQGNEADSLYRQALQKYEQTIQNIQAENPSGKHEECEILQLKGAHSFMGCTLARMAVLPQNESESESLFQKAIKHCKTAIKYGTSTYNLACVYALKGNKEDAFYYLNQALESQDIQFEYVDKDFDFEKLRNEAEYQRLKEVYAEQ